MMAVELTLDDSAAGFAAKQKNLIAMHHRHWQVVVDRHSVGGAEGIGLHIVNKDVIEKPRAFVQVVRLAIWRTRGSIDVEDLSILISAGKKDVSTVEK